MTTSNLTERAASERALHNAHMGQADFNLAPFTIAWEVTRACAYACVHCRADAMHKPDPQELNTEESLRLIDRLAEFGQGVAGVRTQNGHDVNLAKCGVGHPSENILRAERRPPGRSVLRLPDDAGPSSLARCVVQACPSGDGPLPWANGPHVGRPGRPGGHPAGRCCGSRRCCPTRSGSPRRSRAARAR